MKKYKRIEMDGVKILDHSIHIDNVEFKIPYGKTLDLGCGDFRYNHMLGENSVGIDNRVGKDIKLDNTFYCDLNIGSDYQFLMSESYDAITSFGTLHWVYNIDECLEQCYRLLKRGGTFFHLFWSEDVFKSKYSQLLSPGVNWRYRNKFSTKKSKAIKLFESHKFQIEYCEYSNIVIKGDGKNIDCNMNNIVIYGKK